MSEPVPSRSQEEDLRAVEALLRLLAPDVEPERLTAQHTDWCAVVSGVAGGVVVMRMRGDVEADADGLKRFARDVCDHTTHLVICDWREAERAGPDAHGLLINIHKRGEVRKRRVVAMTPAVPRFRQRWEQSGIATATKLPIGMVTDEDELVAHLAAHGAEGG